jgi:hypothetical protein
MKKIRVHFTDFWAVFIYDNNFLLDLLNEKYEVILDAENPEYLFYSCFGDEFLKYDCVRVFFSGENLPINWSNCDWAFSSNFLETERHFRLPIYYYMCGNPDIVTLPKPPIEELVKQKTRFCNFVYSNPSCNKRNNFFQKLSKYRKVDSAGMHLNNCSYIVDDKLEFIKNYKFTIAFENSECNGYTTEKIFEPFVSNSVPIYWGNPLVDRDFNTKSFLNYYDFSSEEDLIKRIIEIDNDDKLLKQYLSEPAFKDNKLNEFVDKERILEQFDKIFSSNIITISSKTYSKPVPIKQIVYCIQKIKFKFFWIHFLMQRFRLSKIKNRFRKKIKKLERK